MIPVYQDNHEPYTANCFDACLASILEMSLKDIPHYADDATWIEDYSNWLTQFNLNFLVVESPVDRLPKGYSVGIINYSTRKNGHAVVCLDGQIVHDPHEGTMSRQEDIQWYGVFIVLDPMKRSPYCSSCDTDCPRMDE